MCGIAGAFLRDPDSIEVNLDAMLSTLIDAVDHRGGDATGFIALDSEGVAEWQRAACDAEDFNKNRRPVPEGTRTILAHTRYATQGLPAFIENNHPLKRGSFYVTHNGHVSNDQELFKLSGRERFGQVDSEAIAARLASLKKLSKADEAMSEIEGAAAIAAVDENHPDQLLLAKGYSSPLYVLVTNKIVLWASTESAIKTAYKKHVGRIPRKRKIEYVPTGTMLFFSGQKQVRRTFKSYSPPVYNKPAYAFQKAYVESGQNNRPSASLVPITKHLPTIGGYPKDAQWDIIEGVDDVEEELLACDSCGATVHYNDAAFVDDPTEQGFTWVMCGLCEGSDLVSEDPKKVNEAILSYRMEGELSD